MQVSAIIGCASSYFNAAAFGGSGYGESYLARSFSTDDAASRVSLRFAGADARLRGVQRRPSFYFLSGAIGLSSRFGVEPHWLKRRRIGSSGRNSGRKRTRHWKHAGGCAHCDMCALPESRGLRRTELQCVSAVRFELPVETALANALGFSLVVRPALIVRGAAKWKRLYVSRNAASWLERHRERPVRVDFFAAVWIVARPRARFPVLERRADVA